MYNYSYKCKEFKNHQIEWSLLLDRHAIRIYALELALQSKAHSLALCTFPFSVVTPLQQYANEYNWEVLWHVVCVGVVVYESLALSPGRFVSKITLVDN